MVGFNELENSKNGGETYYFLIVCEVLFFIDIVLKFLHAYKDSELDGDVTSMEMIAMNYIKETFFIDLLAIIPLWTFKYYLIFFNLFRIIRINECLDL